MNSFQSHEPILSELIDKFNILNVLETGMGYYSTGLFISKCKKITSIEMQEQKWYEEISNKYNNFSRFLPNLLIGALSACQFISNLNEKFDLIFVDGHGKSRWEQINVSFKKSDIIVAHDTEAKVYHWEKVNMPENFIWIDIKSYEPWTSIIINKQKENIINWTDKFINSKYDYLNYKNKDYKVLYEGE